MDIKNWEDLKTILETIAAGITILGVPGAILVFLREKNKERGEKEKERKEIAKQQKDAEYLTYDALDDKYNDFLKICLENPDLNISSLNMDTKLTPQQEYRQLRIFEILISIFERAYLMYQSQNSKLKEKQWTGWNTYMESWMKDTRFRNAWEALGSEWDDEFIKHMEKIYSNTKSSG